MKSIRAFTLVELLVAIAVFAVLSALGWKVFDYLTKVRDRNEIHEARLSALQEAYQQMLRDTLQIAPLSANVNSEVQPPLVLQNGRFSFSKTGVTDPLQQGIAPDERVEYQYRADEKKLYRLKYRNLNRLAQEQPDSSVMLEQVDAFEITVLNPTELSSWPDSSVQISDGRMLPKGIKIRLTVQDEPYEWIFSLLNTDFLEHSNTGNPGVPGAGNGS